MKKLGFLSLLLATQICLSQEIENDVPDMEVNQGKNLVKLNALALTTGNISVQYERLIKPKFSIGASVNIMPERGLPFSSKLEDFVDDQTTVAQLKGISISSFSITPEARFYFGKDSFKGFYIAPFARYGSYSLTFPVNYEYEGHEFQMNVSGKLSSISAGVAFGAQWQVAKNVYLDWMIIGPHYGNVKGDLSGSKVLNEYEQQAINKSLSDLDIPLYEYSYEVNNNGAKIKLDGPWAGLRTSLAIGYRF